MGGHRMIRRRTASLLPIGSACLWIVLSGCVGNEGTQPVGPENPDTVVTSIRVLPSERTIGVLGISPFTVRAEALADGGAVLYGGDRFSWSSSAPEIVTVDLAPHPSTGLLTRLVTGVSEGTATITATSQSVTGSMTVTVQDRARLAWSLPTGTGSIEAGIAIGADGTIYVGTYDHTAGHSVWYALSPGGSVLWTLPLPRTMRSTPAIGADGALYIATFTIPGSLIAIDPGGSIRWVLSGIADIRSSPSIGPEGNIYVAGARHVYAADPRGELQWVYESATGAFSYSSPAVARDGTIYVGDGGGGDGGGHLHAINPDGSLRWTFRTGGVIHSSPSIGRDGTIYFGAMDGWLYEVSADGAGGRIVELDRRGVRSSPSIGPDGTIYMAAGGVFAIDSGSGAIRWHNPSIPGQVTTPILGADGTVYVASPGPLGGTIYALDNQGRLLWDHPTGRLILGSPAIGIDGTILSTSFSLATPYLGTVHAIVETESANGGWAGAPWPQERGDRANTGRAGG